VKVVVSWVLALLVVVGVGVGVEAGLGVRAAPAGQLADGKVCGVTALAGGPSIAVGVKDPALLHMCPSGQSSPEQNFVLISSSGEIFRVHSYGSEGWSATLPAGTYRPTERPWCSVPGPPFVVAPGKTLLGVIVWWGCLYT
jgi:hypothetical protein